MAFLQKYDLEDRLIRFAIAILDVTKHPPTSFSLRNLFNQLCRSGNAPALIYDEAQAAESRADFIHKMKLILKELRETRICLRIIVGIPFPHPGLENCLRECNELIGIFSASIKTAIKNKVKQ